MDAELGSFCSCDWLSREQAFFVSELFKVEKASVDRQRGICTHTVVCLPPHSFFFNRHCLQKNSGFPRSVPLQGMFVVRKQFAGEILLEFPTLIGLPPVIKIVYIK